MSAYVVEDETINRVVNWIFNFAASGQQSHMFKPLVPIGYEFEALASEPEPALELACRKLGHAMQLLNIGAVRQRYDDADTAGMIPAGYRPRIGGSYGSLIQVYKSLRCWLYQCSEGTVPDSPLYKSMDEVCNLLAHHLVVKSEAYEEAAWS